MATGTVSSVSYDNWQLIATNTTTSGTSSSFSCAGYKKLMLAWTAVGSTNTKPFLRFNSSTSGYSGGAFSPEVGNYAGTNGSIFLSSGSGDNYSGCVIIEDVLAAAPKRVNGNSDWGNGGYPTVVSGSWNNVDAITSLTFNASGTFTTGSVSLYGIAG